MSIQGPTIVVAAQPATHLVDALRAAGAFPVVETNWADAPTAFISVKPVAIILADPGPPASDTAARMLCLQVATANGPIVPVIARVDGGNELGAPIPIAMCIDVRSPDERLMARLRAALRVRSLHSTVLRRIESSSSKGGSKVRMPVGDALDDAAVLVVGRAKFYAELNLALGDRLAMVDALSIESATQYLGTRSFDGIIVGDGFSARMIEGFLTSLAQDARWRDLPISLTDDLPDDLAALLPHAGRLEGNLVAAIMRMLPALRLHAFEARLKRVLKSIDADGLFDPETGLLTRESFARDLGAAVGDATDKSGALSLARFSFDRPPAHRAGKDAARLVSELTRNIDFACLEEDGSILVALTQTDLKSAHLVVRRIAAALNKARLASGDENAQRAANVTLASLTAGDNAGSLLMRVMGAQAVAAE